MIEGGITQMITHDCIESKNIKCFQNCVTLSIIVHIKLILITGSLCFGELASQKKCAIKLKEVTSLLSHCK